MALFKNLFRGICRIKKWAFYVRETKKENRELKRENKELRNENNRLLAQDAHMLEHCKKLENILRQKSIELKLAIKKLKERQKNSKDSGRKP